jgi:GrpB-like predicted nucleotidyltransferase (UPF0157 family)
VIDVVDHDPGWAKAAADVIDTYRAALVGVPVVAFEHVGSTAVPGLAAKPVLDIDIVVTEPDVDTAIAVMRGLGYEPLGEQGIDQRWAFRAPAGEPRTHTYVVVEGSVALRNHLGVREVLRGDAGLREEYTLLKRRLAATTTEMAAYVEGKSELLGRILKRAGLSEAERAGIEAANRSR